MAVVVAPLKRMTPWATECSGEIIVGTVDPSGNFSGAGVTSTSLTTILRYFQLSASTHPKIKTQVPDDAGGFAASLADGCPVMIITRGFPGRENDIEGQTIANQSQAEIWQKVRDIRSEIPHIHITCVDVPASAPAELVNHVLEPPLTGYRELAYYGDSWYVPDVINTLALHKALDSVTSSKGKVTAIGDGKVRFDRKKFAWRTVDEDPNLFWKVTWKAVHTDPIPLPGPAKGPSLGDVKVSAPAPVAPKAPKVEAIVPAAQLKGAQDLLKKAQGFLGEDKAEDARKAAKDAIAQFRQAGGGAGMAEAYMVSAKAAVARGHAYSAVNDAKQALMAYSKAEDEDGQGSALALLQSVQDLGVDGAFRVGPKLPMNVDSPDGLVTTHF